jgi:transposase-like protein
MDMTTKKKTFPRLPLEVRARAVRMVQESRASYRSEWAAICSIAAKFGCRAESLRLWLRGSEAAPDGPGAKDGGGAGAPDAATSARLTALEREVRELRQANEILRKASAYFAQAELDRPFKS